MSEKTNYIIGIAGGSGSGKTTFVNRLKAAFKEEQICIVTLDNYYLPREEQYTDNNGIKNFDLPESIQADELVNDIHKLIRGESITKLEYVFNNERAIAKEIEVKPAPIIIVEGLFIYHYEKLKELFDLKLFVHAKDSLKLIRRIKRDRSERNYPLEDVMYRFEHHVLPSFEKYIGRYKDEVDVIINNNDNFDNGLNLVVGFMKNHLKEFHNSQ